jgi:phage shock protein PspC (stress-responsive transcriptional regulator)
MNATTAGADHDTVTGQPQARHLNRFTDNAMLAGVASGVARYLNADVSFVRVMLAVACLLAPPTAAVYIAAWLLIPADGEDQSLAAAWITRHRGHAR